MRFVNLNREPHVRATHQRRRTANELGSSCVTDISRIKEMICPSLCTDVLCATDYHGRTRSCAHISNQLRFKTHMTQLNEQLILDSLRQIKDPDLHKDIVTLGFIRDLKIDGGNVSFRIVLTTPACPVKAEMESAAKEIVGSLPGVTP